MSKSHVVVDNTVGHIFTSNLYYCYLLKHPTTKEVFYVGKGRHYRYREHSYDYCGKNYHKKHTIKNIIKECGYYIAEIVYTTSEESQAYDYEQYLISQYPSLTNIAIGGPWCPSKPTRRVVQYNLFGETLHTYDSYMEAVKAIEGDDNTAKQIMECCRGATPTCGSFHWSWEGEYIKRPRTKIKPVKQLTLQGEYITRYTSLAEAGKCLGIDGRDISGAIKRNGTCAGFKWEYIIL